MDKLEMITRIVEVHYANAEDEEGDKHLASSGYAMEAIDAVLSNDLGNPIAKQFLA